MASDFIFTAMLSDKFTFDIKLGNITPETEHHFRELKTKISIPKGQINKLSKLIEQAANSLQDSLKKQREIMGLEYSIDSSYIEYFFTSSSQVDGQDNIGGQITANDLKNMFKPLPETIELLLNQTIKQGKRVDISDQKPKHIPIPVQEESQRNLVYPKKEHVNKDNEEIKGEAHKIDNKSFDDMKDLIMKLPDAITERLQPYFDQLKANPRPIVQEEEKVIFEGSQCSICEKTNIGGRLYHSIDQDQQFCEECASNSDYAKDHALYVQFSRKSALPKIQPLPPVIKQPLGQLYMEESKSIQCFPGEKVSFKIFVTNNGEVNFPEQTIIYGQKLQQGKSLQSSDKSQITQAIEVCEDGTLVPGQSREFIVNLQAPAEVNTYTFEYQLKNGSYQFGEPINVTLNVAKAVSNDFSEYKDKAEFKQTLNAIIQRINGSNVTLKGQPGNLKTNEVGAFIFKLKNTGTDAWPEDTQLLLVDYDKYPFIDSGKIVKSLNCGTCRKDIFKQIEVKFYQAPDYAGPLVYTFQLGSKSLGGFFGDKFDFKVNVE